MRMRKNFKKILAGFIVAVMLLPVVNFSLIKAAAVTNYLTVEYKASHENFEEAYGTNDRDVRILTIVGDGEITLDDCTFIKENLPVLSVNFTEAKFKNNKVPDGAFKDFYELISLALPPSVTEIGKNAFYNCFMLKNVGLTGSLKIINDNAFYNCAQLETISLPAVVNKIGENAFLNCDSLGTVLALSLNGATYNAAANAFTGVSPRCVLVTPAKATGYDIAPFSQFKNNKVEWIFYALPQNVTVAAGIEYTIPVDVTGIDGSKAKYQWYRDGYEIFDQTGDTLVIKNISQEYAGRYTVAITINNTRALFSCLIGVEGATKNKTEISSKNTAPEHLPEPEKIKYDYIQCLDKNNKTAEEFEITKEIYNKNKLDSPTYILYTKKIKELYDKDKTGSFKFYFTNLIYDGRVEVPFDLINSINSVKNIDLTKDNQLRITINKSGQRYIISFAVTDENGKVLYDFSDKNNLPGVFVYAPHDNKDYMINMIRLGLGLDERIFVPSVKAKEEKEEKDGGMLKFKIRSGFIYSRQEFAPANFNDIKNHWGEKDIINAAKNLIVNGYTDGSYKPDGVLTRAEFTAMLTRVLQHSIIYDSSKIKKYGDVKSSDWFGEAVGLADMAGLTGFATGTDFKPNQQITREEMAYMIAKALDYIGIDTAKFAAAGLNYDYIDKNEIDAKYQNSVKICTNAKLLQGSDGKFMPKKTLTRAEAATVLNRLIGLI